MFDIVYTKPAVEDLKQLNESGLMSSYEDLISFLRATPVTVSSKDIRLPEPFSDFFVINLSLFRKIVYRVLPGNSKEHSSGTVMIVRIVNLCNS